jgi:carboxyl-terminal processing protease
LKNTLAVAKKKKLDESIQVEYQQLLTALQKSEMHCWNKHQKIKGLMVDELRRTKNA